ncbi:MAG: DNA-binding protein [Acidobacteria bacterium]|nr:MAG: DNA-binding protein [Acidobacteriota bacterium]
MRFARENLLSPEELAAMVELKPTTLADWRSARKGPRYLRVGRKIWYPKAFVDVWMGAK